MRVRTMLVGLTVMLAFSTAWAGQKEVREIIVKGLDLGDARWESIEQPTVIKNSDELYDALSDEDAFAAINEQLDFNNEMLLYFEWTGSSEDTLTATVSDNPSGRHVTFVVTPGMTLDLSPHHRFFAVPHDATWQIEVVSQR